MLSPAPQTPALKGGDLFKFLDRLHDVWQWLDLFLMAMDASHSKDFHFVQLARHKLFHAYMAWVDEIIAHYTERHKVEIDLMFFTPKKERELSSITKDLEQARSLLHSIPQNSDAEAAWAMIVEIERLLLVLSAYKTDHDFCLETLGDDVRDVVNALVSRRSMEIY